jgi:hypothetical protein
MKPTPPEDAALDLFERRTYGKSIRHLNCDYCNKALNPGDEAIALSIPSDMRQWEPEYMEVEGYGLK